jgi:hypothetical protein
MDIIKEIKKLDFPADKYVIVGSGPMAVRGLKEAHDIDIVVEPDLFEKCKADGWKEMPWTYEKIGQIYLKRDDIELYLDVNCGDFNPTTEELIKRADVIEGIPFITLEDMLKFKRAYNKAYNREKHRKDIGITEIYLRKQKSYNLL